MITSRRDHSQSLIFLLLFCLILKKSNKNKNTKIPRSSQSHIDPFQSQWESKNNRKSEEITVNSLICTGAIFHKQSHTNKNKAYGIFIVIYKLCIFVALRLDRHDWGFEQLKCSIFFFLRSIPSCVCSHHNKTKYLSLTSRLENFKCFDPYFFYKRITIKMWY